MLHLSRRRQPRRCAATTGVPAVRRRRARARPAAREPAAVPGCLIIGRGPGHAVPALAAGVTPPFCFVLCCLRRTHRTPLLRLLPAPAAAPCRALPPPAGAPLLFLPFCLPSSFPDPTMPYVLPAYTQSCLLPPVVIPSYVSPGAVLPLPLPCAPGVRQRRRLSRCVVPPPGRLPALARCRFSCSLPVHRTPPLHSALLSPFAVRSRRRPAPRDASHCSATTPPSPAALLSPLL